MTPWTLYPQGNDPPPPVPNGGWVGSRVCLNSMTNIHIACLSRNSNFSPPARKLLPYQLSYRDSSCRLRDSTQKLSLTKGLCKISGFQGDHEDCRPLGCHTMWLLYEQTFRLHCPHGVTSRKTAFLTNGLISGIEDTDHLYYIRSR
jgi:hypothetical protein